MALFSKRKPFFEAYLQDDGSMEVRIDVDVFNSTGEAGLMLADFAQHISNAMADSGKAPSSQQALIEVLDMFARELANPTDEAVGGMLE